MKHGDLSTVAIYRDNILVDNNDDDNIIYLTLETKILKEWYLKYLVNTSRHKNNSDEYKFEKWLSEEYTCDDTDGLFIFAKRRGSVMYVES